MESFFSINNFKSREKVSESFFYNKNLKTVMESSFSINNFKSCKKVTESFFQY